MKKLLFWSPGPPRSLSPRLPRRNAHPFLCVPPPPADNVLDYYSKLDMRNFKKPTTHDAHKNSLEEEKRAAKSCLVAANGNGTSAASKV